MFFTEKTELDGGIMGKSGGGVPLKKGSYFAGYEKNGRGERLAKWNKCHIVEIDKVDTENFGADDGIEPKAGGAPLSTTEELGVRGEAIYTVKTAYTEIKLDGVKDPAYDYGLHLKGAIGSNAEYYKDRDTCIEIYIIRGQDGRAYVYGEVTDPDIVINDEIMAFKKHYCDGLHPYVDYSNYGGNPTIIGLITPDASGKYTGGAPAGCCMVITDKGFNFEYSFDNRGKPFVNDSDIAFGFYYNDTNELVDASNYKRYLVKLPSRLNPEGDKFVLPAGEHLDAIRFSEESVSGAPLAKKRIFEAREDDALSRLFGGELSVKIVYPKLTSAHTVICAKYLLRQLSSYGVNVSIVTEDDASLSKADYRIVLDNALDPDSRALVKEIGYNGYGVGFFDGKAVIAGWREDAINSAAELLISAFEYVGAGGKSEELDATYIDRIEEIPCAPELDGLTFVSDAGDGAYQLLRQNASKEDYDAYRDKLLASGYTLYAENQMRSVICATFVNDSAVVNLSYGENEGDRSLRAVVDARSLTALPALQKEKYFPVCETKLYQLAPKKVFYMCYVIKQDNGEYFIIDSGGNGAHRFIYDSLMEISGGEDVVISGWMFTHFHCDHIGGFIEFTDREEYMKKVTVKSIILNFPQWQILDTASDLDHRNIERWQGAVERTGATVYQARTGQKYFFGNIELEMLFTYEDLIPFDIFGNDTNPTSHIFSMSVEGQKFIITGDACEKATELVADRYGDYMKADFVQLPHHGWGSVHTSLDFFKLVDAPYVLYPGPAYAPGASEKWACENSKKYFLDSDRTTELTLPYKE